MATYLLAKDLEGGALGVYREPVPAKVCPQSQNFLRMCMRDRHFGQILCQDCTPVVVVAFLGDFERGFASCMRLASA